MRSGTGAGGMPAAPDLGNGRRRRVLAAADGVHGTWRRARCGPDGGRAPRCPGFRTPGDRAPGDAGALPASGGGQPRGRGVRGVGAADRGRDDRGRDAGQAVTAGPAAIRAAAAVLGGAASVTAGPVRYLVGGAGGARPDPRVLAAAGRRFRVVARLPVPVRYAAAAAADGAIWVFGG